MTEEQGTTFNDSVHGTITLPPLCVKIVDTIEFQRMRNLKQLGLAYLVYPGASHNRFEHSLGVCHLAGRMVDQLNNNSDSEEKRVTAKEKLCVQIAGLCHDMGHGPFSHAWEGFLKERLKLPAETEWKHEKCSTYMFQHMIDSNNLDLEFKKYGLGEKDIKFIKTLIEGKTSGRKEFLSEIISNPLNGVDVDKWDYFLRDSKYLNLSQSFDHNRLLATCRVMEVEGSHSENGKMHIAFRDKDVFNVWDMFQVRAQLHWKAYQHPVVKILEQMWTDALIAADVAGYTVSTADHTSVPLSEAQNNPKVWKYVTDHIFYEILNNGEMLPSGELRFAKAQLLLRRILKRELYYKIVLEDLKDLSTENAEKNIKAIEKILQENSSREDIYCLQSLVFDMGKKKEGITAFSNFFFYKKTGIRAESIDISKGAVFPVSANIKELKRKRIMVLNKTRKRARSDYELSRKDKIVADEIKRIVD